MVWKVKLSSLARKNLDSLGPQNSCRILAFFRKRVAPLDAPRNIGKVSESLSARRTLEILHR